MRVTKAHQVNTPEGAPHEHTGKLTFNGGTAKENNLFAGFVENVWNRKGGKMFSVMFFPTMRDLQLLVNAKNQKLVVKILDETIKEVRALFKANGGKLALKK